MAKLADAYVSEAYGSDPLEVQVLFRAQKKKDQAVPGLFSFLLVEEEFVRLAKSSNESRVARPVQSS